jgi:hypothetical protein
MFYFSRNFSFSAFFSKGAVSKAPSDQPNRRATSLAAEYAKAQGLGDADGKPGIPWVHMAAEWSKYHNFRKRMSRPFALGS